MSLLLTASPFLILRCISDHADENATHSYESFDKIAGHQSAATIVMEMIRKI